MGGGVVLVPSWCLFDFDVRAAISTSLVAVVATSAAGSIYGGSGLANMRLGMIGQPPRCAEVWRRRCVAIG